MNSESHLLFPPFRLDPINQRLWREAQEIPLRQKTFAVLRYLVEHPDQLVTKEALLDALWPETYVSDTVLTVCIRELRRALSDDKKTPRFIATVHGRGYRFLPPVTIQPVQSPKFKVPRVDTQDSALRTQHSALVGREMELAQLRGWFDKALSGERQMVFVTGEAGIGKTALVEVFLQCLSTDDDSLWIGRGQCIEHYGAGEAYMPILEAVSRLCREPDGERLIHLLSQYAPTWLAQLPNLVDAETLDHLQRTTAGATQERRLRELTEAIEFLTREKPLVLWLEDLHWSDPSTVAFLSLLARRKDTARVLVLGSYRPVELHDNGHPLHGLTQDLLAHQLCRALPLPLLAEDAVAEYVRTRFPVNVTPLTFARALHHRTEGHPFFLVSVLNDLVDRGVLEEVEGIWVLKDRFETVVARVPESVQHLVARQLEQLHPTEQCVLEAASLAGQEFSVAAVAAALATDMVEVGDQCAHLARRQQFLHPAGIAEWPDGTVAARYKFQHALYQHLWHERIGIERQQQWHLRIGERKEAAYGQRAGEIAAELALHFEQGRDYRRAVRYLQLAGETAVRRSAHQEAIMHFTKGLELVKTLPDTREHTQQEFTLQLALTGPRTMTQGFAAPEVEHAYGRALELCRQGGETPQLFEALGGLCGFYIVRAEHRKARELAEQCLSLAQRIQDPVLLLPAHFRLGVTLFWHGEFARARDHQEQALALYHAQQNNSYSASWLNPGVSCLNYMASILMNLGYLDQALKRSQEALALARELAHPFSTGMALCFVAGTHLARGEGPAAQKRAEELITLSTEQGFTQLLADGTRFRGSALVQQGRVEEGITQIELGIRTGRGTGFEMGLIGDLAGLALAYVKAGQVEKGLTLVAEALALVAKTGERVNEAGLHVLKGWFLLARSRENHTEAEACFRQAFALARHQSAKLFELHAVMGLARLWRKQGKQDEARKLLGEIYSWFTEGFGTVDLKEAKALLDELA